jgi:hypothetical protein
MTSELEPGGERSYIKTDYLKLIESSKNISTDEMIKQASNIWAGVFEGCTGCREFRKEPNTKKLIERYNYSKSYYNTYFKNVSKNS